MVLVDTSIWIEYLQGDEGPGVEFLEDLLKNPLAVGICDLIYMEVLQGAKNVRLFDSLRAYFSGQRFYSFNDSLESHAAAARTYFEARRVGITLRSTLDCLIAQTALEHDLLLLHQDRDFLRMQSLLPSLKQKHFLAE